MQTRYDAKNPPALRRLLDKGVTLRPFPDDVMRFARSLLDVWHGRSEAFPQALVREFFTRQRLPQGRCLGRLPVRRVFPARRLLTKSSPHRGPGAVPRQEAS